MSALRDLIDEIEDLFSKMSRKTKITGQYPDEAETEKLRKVVRKSFLQINVYKVVEQLLDDFLLCSVPVWHHSSLLSLLSVSYQKV